MTKPLRSRDNPDLATEIANELERLKWFVWHGNVFRALQVVEDLEIDLDLEHATPEQRKLLKAVTEFGGYIRANASCIPNYGEKYRNGETISSAFVESAVNQVVSKRMVKQLMRWTSECSCRSALVRSTASYPSAALCRTSRRPAAKFARPHSDGGTRLVAGRELATTFRAWYPAWAWTTTLPVEELAAGT